MSAPNLLSLSRFALIPVILWSMITGRAGISLGVFVLAVLSDFFDGILARRTGQTSRLGMLIDHSADAAFVTAVISIGAWLDLQPWLLPGLIVIAFTQYVVDSGSFTGAPLRASSLGRWNGIAYFVIAGLIIGVHHYAHNPQTIFILRIIGWALIVTTLVSIVMRSGYRAQR